MNLSTETREPRHYAGMPIKVTLREWDKANALVPEIFQWLATQGIAPAGGPIYRYHTVGDADHEFDLEVGVPVADKITTDGRVLAGLLPGGQYAVAVHHGHPDRLDESHAELQKWVAEQGLSLATSGTDAAWTSRYETYLTNPEEQPDPYQWSTEIAYLLS